MLRSIAKLGVKRTLFLAIGGALALAGVFTAFTVNRVVLGALEEALAHRGESDARVLASSIAAPLAQNREDLLAAEVEASFDEKDNVYVVVLRSDYTIATKHFSRNAQGSAEDVRDAFARSPGERALHDGELYRFAVPVKAVVSRPDGSRGEREVGYLLLGLSASETNARLGQVRLMVLGLLGLGGLLLASLVYVFTMRLVLAPLDQMTAVARKMSDSNLAARADRIGDDELGTLADSLNKIGENLSATISRVQTVTGGVAAVIERIDRTGKAVSEGAGTVSARVVDTSASMGQMIASLKGIADNVEVLAQSAEESSSSILELSLIHI